MPRLVMNNAHFTRLTVHPFSSVAVVVFRASDLDKIEAEAAAFASRRTFFGIGSSSFLGTRMLLGTKGIATSSFWHYY